jgi:hypothetical protein
MFLMTEMIKYLIPNVILPGLIKVFPSVVKAISTAVLN